MQKPWQTESCQGMTEVYQPRQKRTVTSTTDPIDVDVAVAEIVVSDNALAMAAMPIMSSVPAAMPATVVPSPVMVPAPMIVPMIMPMPVDRLDQRCGLRMGRGCSPRNRCRSDSRSDKKSLHELEPLPIDDV